MRSTLLINRIPINWTAAFYAGIAAGIIATMAQIILWWAFSDSLPGIMFRDARLAAAIILGEEILPMQVAFDWPAMIVATMIHFTLSVVYGTILAAFIVRYSMAVSIVVGIEFGFILFGVNMFGFTLIFPWFEEARDWITLVAHIVFGIVAAVVYRVLSVR
jgi:uncharacterized membrane protein YjdF